MFLEDMHSRGLLDSTLVVVMGEFGRAPLVAVEKTTSIRGDPGRKHWAACYSVLLAGAGVVPGALYGKSDRIAAYPASDPWSVADGVIVCTGKPNGCMVTKKEYGDYVLKVKWRWPADGKGGNSGVLLHVQDEKYWPTSIEAQLLTGRAGDLLVTNPPDAKLEGEKARQDPKLERRFFRAETKEPVEKKLGEWNEMEITCGAGDIT